MALSVARPGADWRRPAGLVAAGVAVGVGAGALAAFAGPLYAFAGLVGLAAGVVLLVNQRACLLGFVAVATLLPFGVVPLSIGGVRLTFIDVTVTLLLLTALLRTLARRDGGAVATPVDAPLVLFLGLAVAAFVFGTGYAATPETTRQYFKLLNSTLFFFTIVQTLRSERDVRLVVRALAIGGAVAAVIGIVLYHLPEGQASGLLRSLRPLGYPTGEVLRYVEDNGVRTKTLRAIGTSIDPNVFGALLFVTGTLMLGELLEAPRRLRPWFALGLGATVYALLLSLSRGSWVGFAAAVAILTLARYRRLLWAIPAISLPAVLLFWNEAARFVDRFLKAVYAQDQATGMRLGEYKDALTLISQNPWLGVGFGGTPSSDLYLGVSSTYLMVAEEMGLLGLGAYLLVVGVVVVTAVRRFRGLAPARQPLALACLAAFGGVLVAAAFDKHFFDLRYQHIAALYWLLAALVLLSSRTATADNPR